GGYSNRMDRLADGTRVMLVSRRLAVDDHPALMRLAYSTEPIWQRVNDWVFDTLLSLGAMLVIAGVAGHQLAKRALGPIDHMASRVERLRSDQLDERLPVDVANDELAHLARVFNHLLERVDASFDQLRRFTSDASHELRTPLAAIRSVGEVALEHASTPAEYR